MALDIVELSVTLHCKQGGQIYLDGEINAVLDKITELMMEGTEKDIGASFTVGGEAIKLTQTRQ